MILAALTIAQGQARTPQTEECFERVYVSTDRSDYISGERIWCSAFCFDAQGGRGLSDYSAVAYLQLLSERGNEATAKIALEGGRGGGYLDIPENLPSGKYSLVAYTALNKNEEGYDFLKGAKTISVFNVLSNDRVKGTLEICSEDSFKPVRGYVSSGVLEVQHAVLADCSDANGILLQNKSGRAASFSVSVWHDDELVETLPDGICSFDRGGAPGRYTRNVVPEYDGEIIYASITGPDKDLIYSPDNYVTTYISSIGCPNDIYTTLIGRDRQLLIKTYNIYGNKDIVCEVDGEAEELDAHIELNSPFLDLKGRGNGKLRLHKGMEKRLLERGRAMMSAKRDNRTDTIPELLPRKEQILLRDDACRCFELDDYTRFPTMEEVLVEIIPIVRARKQKGRSTIQVYSESAFSAQPLWGKALVLLDGVPIFDHQKLMEYDAMMIKRVKVWPKPTVIGNNFYEGVVNFETSSGHISYMDFSRNVRIVDFQGVSFPESRTLRHNRKSRQDLRQTIYWHPLQEIGVGESIRLDCLTPDYPGTFRLVIEGVLDDGTPFSEHSSFRVD